MYKSNYSWDLERFVIEYKKIMGEMSMKLSKSKYTRFCQCPKMLWLDKNKPEVAVMDEALQKRFEEGNEVGDLAMGLLGNYVEVTTLHSDGSLNIPAMLAKTKSLVAAGEQNICEASFQAKNCFCAVDILHAENDGYAIYEVKSSTQISEVYLWDVAYQKWLLEQAGINVTGAYIVHIDNEYVKDGDIDIHKLFKIESVWEEIMPYCNLVEGNVVYAQEYMKQAEEPDMPLGGQCNNPYACAYWQYCSRNLPSPSVFDLYRMNFKKACEYYNSGIATFEDCLNSGIKLSEKQLTQIKHAQLELPTYVDKAGVQQFLNSLWYPLYFLDFETYQACVPLYDGTRPYQQVPFQYSLHYITVANGELKHKEFLADERHDSRRELAERLCEDIPLGACVLAYNKAFECTRITELAQTYPDLSDKLIHIKGNIRDLLDVFQGGYVYNRAMGGSFSIKSVLPAIFPDNPNLNYHNLEDVHNGSEAMGAYFELRKMEGEERERLRQSLLAYCKLDTMAMVMLWQRLKELAL